MNYEEEGREMAIYGKQAVNACERVGRWKELVWVRQPDRHVFLKHDPFSIYFIDCS